MLNGTDASRRRTVELRIVAEVARYFKEYGQGMAMQILSAKYSRALKDIGGFPEVMLELEQAGAIAIDTAVSGRRTVRPALKASDGQLNAAYWF